MDLDLWPKEAKKELKFALQNRLFLLDAFPARVQLGANSIGWRADEVKAWIEARPRGVSQKPLSSSNGSDAELVTGRQS
jgi:hypothetical protein